jgi:hypothetical protein
MKNLMKFATGWLFVGLAGILIFMAIVLLIVINNLYILPTAVPVFEPTPTNGPGVKAPAVTITSPRPGELLTSPLTIAGEARGWYFEGSFPVELKDANGATLATGQATAQSDWTTADPVPFKAVLTFVKPATASGTLILKKDNPSGLPANDAQASFPVQFNLADQAWNPAPPIGACRVGGCSGELCTDQGVVSDCIYLPEYACYKTAVCARQKNGQCGWTQTQAINDCLAKAR